MLGEGGQDSQDQPGETHSRLILCPEPFKHRQGTEGLPDQHSDFLQGDQVTGIGGVLTASAQLPWEARSQVLPLTCYVLSQATLSLK